MPRKSQGLNKRHSLALPVELSLPNLTLAVEVRSCPLRSGASCVKVAEAGEALATVQEVAKKLVQMGRKRSYNISFDEFTHSRYRWRGQWSGNRSPKNNLPKPKQKALSDCGKETQKAEKPAK